MANSRWYRPLCALGAICALVDTSQATTAAPEPEGWLTGDGLHLTWGAFWQTRQRQAADELERQRRQYERCLNPGNGLGILGQFLGGLSTGRWRYAPAFPQRQPNYTQPRRDCGSPPSVSAANDTFRLMVDDGTRQIIGSFSFRTDGINLVVPAGVMGGRCFVILDAAGRPIPVRHAGHPDPYGIRNPLNPATDPVRLAVTKVQQLRSELVDETARMQASASSLASLSNYSPRTGSCSEPQRQAYPARPAAMPDAMIEDQAVGSCVDLMTRRHDPAKVMAALRSVRWDSAIDAAKRYRARPAQCATNISHSQFEDQKLRVICAFADFGCYGQIQSMVQQCVVQVRNSCSAPLDSWRQRIAQIDAAPRAAKLQCDSALANVAQSNVRLTDLRSALAIAEAELAAAQAQPRADNAVAFADAHCGGSNG